MFIKTDLIQGVKSFDVGKHLCCYHIDKTVTSSNGLNTVGPSLGTIYCIDEKVFIQSYRGGLQVVELDTKSTVYQNDRDQFKMFLNPIGRIVDGKKVYVNKVSNQKEEYGLLDLGNSGFYPIGENADLILDDHNIRLNWVNEPETLSTFFIDESKPSWNYHLSRSFVNTLGEEINEGIDSFLGIYETNLIFSLKSGSIILLDINDGGQTIIIDHEKHILPEFNYEKNGTIPYGSFVQFDESTFDIFALRDQYYLFLKLNEGQALQYLDLRETFLKHKISSSYRNREFPFDTNYIYFCDDRQGKIAVFDRHQKEVIWSHQLDIKQEGIAQILDMKYQDNKWYVLDRHQTLHIFERTD